jgi:hypothetical protein
MKPSVRNGIMLLLPLIVAGVILGAVRAFPNAQRGVTIEPATFKCQAQAGQKVLASYSLKNTTRKPIKILGADAGCGCVVAQGLPLELQAGETRTLTLEIKIGPNGRFAKTTQLLTNSDTPIGPLQFEASVSGAE